MIRRYLVRHRPDACWRWYNGAAVPSILGMARNAKDSKSRAIAMSKWIDTRSAAGYRPDNVYNLPLCKDLFLKYIKVHALRRFENGGK